MPWAATGKPSTTNLHHELHSHSALSSLESGLSKWLLVAGIAAVALVLAPVILPYFGIGGAAAAALSEECCTIVGTKTGMAWGLTKAIESIPVIGTYLSTAGGQNILAPAATILGGQAVGSLVSHYEKAAGKKGTIGSFIRIASMGVGVVLSLPAILPGIGHGVQFASRLAGMGEYGNAIAQFLGNTHACTSVATTNGIMGGVSTLAAHLPCAIPAVVASFPLLAPAMAKDSSLAPHDPNHAITSEQQTLVEAYNQASLPQKVIMQQWFHDHGFDPDFHTDGTMHLYKHPDKIARA